MVKADADTLEKTGNSVYCGTTTDTNQETGPATENAEHTSGAAC